jgi:hypothetical protein
MSILTAVGPGLHSEEGLEADQAFQGLTELSADPTRHSQVRGRGVYSYMAGLRGLELADDDLPDHRSTAGEKGLTSCSLPANSVDISVRSPKQRLKVRILSAQAEKYLNGLAAMARQELLVLGNVHDAVADHDPP